MDGGVNLYWESQMTAALDIQAATAEYNSIYGSGPNREFIGVDAVRWGKNALGSTYWSKQEEIIESVFDNRKTVVRSCNGPGKTFVASDIALCFLLNMSPAIVITTAPTFKQVKDVLWAEIRTKYDESLAAGMRGIECHQTRLEVAPGWFMLGISPDQAVNLQGFHQTNVLIILDEAPGVKPEIVQGAETLMAAGNVHALWIGNPLQSSGHFYNAFRFGDWNRVHISYEMTPNFVDQQDNPDPRDVNLPDSIKQKLISPEWVEERREEWGEDSPAFMSGCLGEFPKDDGLNVIPLQLCMDAINRETEPTGPMVLGVDVGAGGDLTAYARRRGQVILDVTTQSTSEPEDVFQRILEMHQRDQYTMITIDSCGIGWGVVGTLRKLGLPVRGLNVSERANDPEHYPTRRDELWYAGRDWLKYGALRDNDEQLKADLTAPIQLPPDHLGRRRVESKKDTKKRLKMRSPDRADAVLLAIQSSASSGVWAW